MGGRGRCKFGAEYCCGIPAAEFLALISNEITSRNKKSNFTFDAVSIHCTSNWRVSSGDFKIIPPLIFGSVVIFGCRG